MYFVRGVGSKIIFFVFVIVSAVIGSLGGIAVFEKGWVRVF